MRRELTVVPLLMAILLGIEAFRPAAVQTQGLTLTLRTDQATYQVGSQATVTLILHSATPLSGETSGFPVLGCSWNIVILDATGTEVFNVREGFARQGIACADIAEVRNVPPPIVKRATIPLTNNLDGGDPLPPGLYTVRGRLNWYRKTVCQGCGPQSAEVVIEITREP